MCFKVGIDGELGRRWKKIVFPCVNVESSDLGGCEYRKIWTLREYLVHGLLFIFCFIQ